MSRRSREEPCASGRLGTRARVWERTDGGWALRRSIEVLRVELDARHAAAELAERQAREATAAARAECAALEERCRVLQEAAALLEG